VERISNFNDIAALWIICGWQQVSSLLWSIFPCLLRNNYIKECMAISGDQNAMHSRFSCLSFFLPPKMVTNRNYSGTSNMLSTLHFRRTHIPHDIDLVSLIYERHSLVTTTINPLNSKTLLSIISFWITSKWYLSPFLVFWLKLVDSIHLGKLFFWQIASSCSDMGIEFMLMGKDSLQWLAC
jgi:hypothetical protein